MKFAVLTSMMILAFSTAGSAQVSSSFDYEIVSVQMFNIDEVTGSKQYVHDLGAYLYDIGPRPSFQFEVVINQIEAPSHLANRAQLVTERYILLESKKEALAYSGIDSVYKDLAAPHPSWVYNGPIDMAFERKKTDSGIIFTSPPIVLDFVDPDNPLTYAAPYGYRIHGFAYRFLLIPARPHQHDINLANNAFQLTFIKP